MSKAKKRELLKYGLREGHFTIEEYCFIMNGNKLEDYDLYEELKDYPLNSFEKLCIIKSNKLEEELDINLQLNLSGATY